MMLTDLITHYNRLLAHACHGTAHATSRAMNLSHDTESMMEPNRRVILWLHRIPRFGHSNNLALLASDNHALQEDYTDGIVSFAILIILVAFVWCLALVVLKFYYGPDRVGCAAGGQPVNVSTLRKNKLSRSKRRSIIVRSWRTQAAFLVCSLGLTTLSFLFVNHGLKPFMESLAAIDKAARDIDIKASEAMDIARTVEQLRDNLVSWDVSMNGTAVCPNYTTSPLSQDFRIRSSRKSLSLGIKYLNKFVEQHADGFVSSVGRMMRATSFVETKIKAVSSKQALVEAFLIAFNILNALLFFGCLSARNNFYHRYYQRACTNLLVPAFCLLIASLIALTCVSSSVSVLNADFCSGGSHRMSSMGTILDLLTVRGMNSTGLSYRAIKYYAQECPGANPLGTITHGLGRKMLDARDSVQTLATSISTYDSAYLSATCGGELNPYMETLSKMHQSLEMLYENTVSAENLTSCASVSPILQTVVHGPPCSQSVEGLSCLLGTSCGMLILGLIMLSIRAALYNPIIKPLRRKRREREFKEYVEYMGTFYDTADWKVDSLCTEVKGGSIEPAPTFETTGSDEPSPTRSHENDCSSNDSDCSGQLDGIEPTMTSATRQSSVRDEMPSVIGRLSSHVAPSVYSLRLNFDDDPKVEYYSSDSEDDDSVGAKTNISALVSRFFIVQRGADSDLSISTGGELNTSSRSFRSLLGPASGLWTPLRKKKASNLHLDQSNVPFDESFNGSEELSLEVERLTPSPDRSHRRKHLAPQKIRRNLLRTHGASKIPASRTDYV